MAKTIAIFIDGTGNLGTEGGARNTNVYKLWRLTDPRQLSIYIEGIGTDPKPGPTTHLGRLRAWARGKHEELLGIGASDRVCRAYTFLAQNYNTNDQVFLFGFSRGAFIVRMLAGFIHRVGLLFAHQATAPMVTEAFALYCADLGGAKFEAYVRRVEASNGAAESIVTHFLGQWDAVETLDILGIPSEREALLREVAIRHVNDPLPPWIRNACHALALHEARQPFEPFVWSGVSDEDQHLQQAWFAGAHADVGGGYADNDGAGSRFSDIALQWMWDEAHAAKLAMLVTPVFPSLRQLDVPHLPELVKFGGLPARVRPALATMAQRDTGVEFLHDSVLERMQTPIRQAYDKVIDYLPTVWYTADAIALQAHFAQCVDCSVRPDLTPESLRTAEDRLFDYLEGKALLPPQDIELLLALLLICLCKPRVLFHGASFDQAAMRGFYNAALAVRDMLRLPQDACSVLRVRHATWRAWLDAIELDSVLVGHQ